MASGVDKRKDQIGEIIVRVEGDTVGGETETEIEQKLTLSSYVTTSNLPKPSLPEQDITYVQLEYMYQIKTQASLNIRPNRRGN
jgi:hypothetical protein